MALNHPLPLPPPPTRGKLSQNGFFGQVGSGGRCGGGRGEDGVIWHREEQDKSGKADLEFFNI
jgi:hypothetical protein